MIRVAFAIALWLAAASAAAASDACFGTDADAMADALAKAGSCRAAYAKLSECAWGSTADVGFADIVIKTCEGDFLAKLSATARANYADEAGLCDYEYERQDGSMFRSLAALCRAGVASRFAETPALADRPLPPASFDCAKARSPLEKTVCADPKLGRADVMLSRVYGETMKSLTPDERRVLNANERRWMEKVVADCRLTEGAASAKARDCVRDVFEARFTLIGECAGAADLTKCVSAPQ